MIISEDFFFFAIRTLFKVFHILVETSDCCRRFTSPRQVSRCLACSSDTWCQSQAAFNRLRLFGSQAPWRLGVVPCKLVHIVGEPPNLTIVSDRQKGLILALKNTIPFAMYCYYCRQIAKNIKDAFSDRVIVMKFWRATKSYRRYEYEAYITDIRAVSQEAFNYIEEIGRRHWANAQYHRVQCTFMIACLSARISRFL